MGIKIKNLQTGEFEKFNIPALKGEKGEPGEIEPSEKVDYIGKQHSKLRDTMNANVDYIIKTAIGEFNYLDYEGQHITATNSIEGHVKSAILKGQTLVNLATKTRAMGSQPQFDGDTITITSTTDGAWYSTTLRTVGMKAGGTYLLYTDSITYDDSLSSSPDSKSIAALYEMKLNRNVGRFISNGAVKVTIPSDVDVSDIGLRIHATLQEGTGGAGKTTTVKGLKIIEYQDGMENWDIPYFEGMASVKAPVLTTTGKNLYNKSPFNGYIDASNGKFISGSTTRKISDYIEVEPNKKYKVSGCTMTTMWGYDKDKNPISVINIYVDITTTSDMRFIAFTINAEVEHSNIQIEEGSAATPFEPYKSNTLTTPEDLELRGIGDVKDELNVATGELTQRIGEVVLDGSENWSKESTNDESGDTDTTTCYYTSINDIKLQSHCAFACKELPYRKVVLYHKINDYEGISKCLDDKRIFIRINQSRLTEQNINGFKQWLSQNPITIQYELATESIKTVDLSDNHVYSYKGTTHYDCSSAEGSLVPTLSVKVPTDTQLTIQEQKAATQTLLIKNMDLQQSIKEVQAMNLAFNTALYNSFNSIREEVEDIKKHVSTNENLEGSF